MYCPYFMQLHDHNFVPHKYQKTLIIILYLCKYKKFIQQSIFLISKFKVHSKKGSKFIQKKTMVFTPSLTNVSALSLILSFSVIGFLLYNEGETDKLSTTESRNFSMTHFNTLLTDSCNGKTKQNGTPIKDDIESNFDFLWSSNNHQQILNSLNETFCINECNNKMPDLIKQSLKALLIEKVEKVNETNDDWILFKSNNDPTMIPIIRDIYQCIDGECGKENQKCCNTNSILFDEACPCINDIQFDCINDKCITDGPHPKLCMRKTQYITNKKEKDPEGYSAPEYATCEACLRQAVDDISMNSCIVYSDCNYYEGRGAVTVYDIQGGKCSFNYNGQIYKTEVVKHARYCTTTTTIQMIPTPRPTPATPAPTMYPRDTSPDHYQFIYDLPLNNNGHVLQLRNDLQDNTDHTCQLIHRNNGAFGLEEVVVHPRRGYDGEFYVCKTYKPSGRKRSILGEGYKCYDYNLRIDHCEMDSHTYNSLGQTWTDIKWCMVSWRAVRMRKVIGFIPAGPERFWKPIDTNKDQKFAFVCQQ